MWGRSTKNMKSKLYPAVIVASGTLLLGLLMVLLLGRFQVEVWTEPATPVSPLPETAISPSGGPTPNPERSPASSSPDTAANSSLAQSGVQSQRSPAATSQPGGLRVSNPTEHPVRLVLLGHQSVGETASPRTPSTSQSAYAEPAHWDFAPGEGGDQGLILSLPEQNLQLKKGDILVAFAQDGSRIYWGPYVVGETPLPLWNRKKSEWDLTLPP